MFSFGLHALTFRQTIKLIVVKLFWLRSNELVNYDILQEAVKRGYKFRKLTSNIFQIINGDKTPSFLLRKRTSDLLVFNQVILKEEYRTLCELVDTFYSADKIECIIDAGANIGITSLYLSNIFNNAKLIAVEPSEGNFLVLKTNILHNENSRVIPFNNALWFECDVLRISNNFRDGQEWSLKVTHDSSGQGSINAITLKEIIIRGNVKIIDILKIDIEGSERELLNNSEFLNLLKDVKFLAIELHEEMVDKIQVINLLQSIGFELIYKGETLFGVNRDAL